MEGGSSIFGELLEGDKERGSPTPRHVRNLSGPGWSFREQCGSIYLLWARDRVLPWDQAIRGRQGAGWEGWGQCRCWSGDGTEVGKLRPGSGGP